MTMTQSFYFSLAGVFLAASVEHYLYITQLGDVEDIATVWPHTCVFRAMISKIDGRQAIVSEFHSVKHFNQRDYVFYLQKVIFVFEDAEEYFGLGNVGPQA